MKPPDFEYVRPSSIAEAVSILAQSSGDAKVLAGGQSLVPLLNFRLASPAMLVDINRLPELSFLEVSDRVLRVGAMTRTRALELDPLVRQAIPVLAAAALWVGHVQIRNRGTVGGSLAHADPAAELPAVSVLLDAEIVATGPGGDRRIAADDFFLDFLTTTLEEDELVTEIRIPIPPADEGWGFREFAQRRGDFALAGTAVRVPAVGGPGRARIVVFGTADRPRRADGGAEALLAGQARHVADIAEAARLAAEDATRDDPRPDAAYRRTVTETLVRRALQDAVGMLGSTVHSETVG